MGLLRVRGAALVAHRGRSRVAGADFCISHAIATSIAGLLAVRAGLPCVGVWRGSNLMQEALQQWRLPGHHARLVMLHVTFLLRAACILTALDALCCPAMRGGW